MRTSTDRAAFPRAGGATLVAVVFIAAAMVLLATGTSRLRYSADHDRTIGVWEIAIPVAVAMLIARLVPPPRLPLRPEPAPDQPRREAWACVWLGVAFAAATIAFDGGYVAFKLGFLAVAPTLMLTHRSWLTGFPQHQAYRHWWWIGPAAATLAWFALAWIGPYARPSTSDLTVVTVAVGFVFNAYLEERFYRGWLQTRLEHVYGRWTAIGAASLLWAAWHVAIHSTGRPLVDIATVIAHLGVLGLLLGYLWARFRNPWPLLAIHAAINTPLDLLVTTWT